RRRGRRGRRRRGRGRARGEGEARASDEVRAEAPEGSFEARDAATGESLESDSAADAPQDSAEEDLVEHEVDAALAEHESAREPAPQAEPVEPPPRARRSRAAVVVRDEPESILAGLVLARDRRTIVSFRVIPQDALMDFFKGPATDLPDNV